VQPGRQLLPGWEPPDEGYFRIWQRWQEDQSVPMVNNPNNPALAYTAVDRARCVHNSTLEGDEAVASVIPATSVRATTHVLQFTCRMAGDGREAYRTVNLNPDGLNPGSGLQNQGPSAYRFTDRMITNWYEVTYFLKPNGETAGGTTPLFNLYRREKAVSALNGTFQVQGQAIADVSGSFDPSQSPAPYVANTPASVTDPRHRFGMDPSTKPGDPLMASAFRKAFRDWTLQDDFTTLFAGGPGPAPPGGPTRWGDDILLSDVVSFDVKVLQQGYNPSDPAGKFGTVNSTNPLYPQFVDLPPSPLSRNSYFNDTAAGRYWSVFDTWCKTGAFQRDVGSAPAVEGWNANGQNYSLPLAIRIYSLQITIRVWDQRSEQTRQVSIIQEM